VPYEYTRDREEDVAKRFETFSFTPEEKALLVDTVQKRIELLREQPWPVVAEDISILREIELTLSGD
jgi:hypothetical protein